MVTMISSHPLVQCSSKLHCLREQFVFEMEIKIPSDDGLRVIHSKLHNKIHTQLQGFGARLG